MKSPQYGSEEIRQSVWLLRDAKGEGHARADLAGRLAIDARSAQSKVDCNIVLDLPNCPDKGGPASKQANIALIEEFRDRSHGPVMRTFDDGVEKVIGMLLARKLNLRVEVDRSPVPALRDDTVKDCSGPMLIINPRQENAKLGGDWARASPAGCPRAARP